MPSATRDGARIDQANLTGIVGLGASAGGLDPLGQFLANVPANTGLAFVVVQHLDPTHKAMLTELLQRTTVLQVREATSAMRIEPNVVYVIPPNSELTVAGNVLHVTQPTQPRGLRLPIDVLFSSLARDQGELAIGAVFSGMGADGSLGLQAIKSQGGLALVQQPESAQFDSMPGARSTPGRAISSRRPATLRSTSCGSWQLEPASRRRARRSLPAGHSRSASFSSCCASAPSTTSPSTSPAR
jgi:two-component system CheB/CheR fusion protein